MSNATYNLLTLIGVIVIIVLILATTWRGRR
jgi:hypothetical protein